MKRKEYLYKAQCENGNIFYIGYVFGKYDVFATNQQHTFNYSVYGNYKNLGNAERKLKEIGIQNNATKYCFMSKKLLHEIGAFHNEKTGGKKT